MDHPPAAGADLPAAMAAGTIKELPEKLARAAHDWTRLPDRSEADFSYCARRTLAAHPDGITR